MLTAVVGINWGDEGKGRMVDLLSADYDIVCRYQGGNNAGHTVINDYGKIVLNLLPSGISREGTVNVMGNGMVIDLEHLVYEIQSLREKGIHIGSDNLKMQYDIYHMQRMEGELANTLSANLKNIGHMQLADNPGRHEPGTGEINFPWLLRHIDAIGYDGWIGCEYKPATTTEAGLGWRQRLLGGA